MLMSLTLHNFRTYKTQTFEFHPALTIIVGPNAVGKTNVLEAIYALSIGKSFRAETEKEMVLWGENCARVIGTTDEDKLEIVLTTGKRFLVNGVARRQVDFAGKLPAVLFWPEDLSLVIGSPSVRREYINRILVQTDREYRRMLAQYEKGLRQRNKVLLFIHEGRAQRSQLVYWNDLLIKTGEYITNKRKEFVEFLNSHQPQDASYQLEYDKSVISEERLAQYKDQEIAAKTTLVGPHRDDVQFTFKDVDLARYGSRGEQRLGVFWYKLGELSYLEKEKKRKPVLLLDDICSELDYVHQQEILLLIDKYQTILTSAERSVLERLGKKDIKVIELK